MWARDRENVQKILSFRGVHCVGRTFELNFLKEISTLFPTRCVIWVSNLHLIIVSNFGWDCQSLAGFSIPGLDMHFAAGIFCITNIAAIEWMLVWEMQGISTNFWPPSAALWDPMKSRKTVIKPPSRRQRQVFEVFNVAKWPLGLSMHVSPGHKVDKGDGHYRSGLMIGAFLNVTVWPGSDLCALWAVRSNRKQ